MIGDEVFVQKPLVASSSVIVCISGKRKQWDGTLVSLSRRGQKCSKRGFRAMSEAQMIPMLTSTADHVTAWMPDSVDLLDKFLVIIRCHRCLPTSRPVFSKK